MISFGEAKRIEGLVKSYPSHDLILRDDMIDKLVGMTKMKALVQGLGKDSIPADITLDDTIPTLDFFIRVNDADTARARIIITDRIEDALPKDNSIRVVGVVIFDYGITKPMMFFGVKRRSKQLILLDDVWWYGAKDTSDAGNLHNKFGLENMSKLKMFRTVMQIWYGLEHIMLYPSLYPREMNLFNRNTFVIYDDGSYFPDKIDYEHNDDKNDKRKSYYRRKLAWFVRGHFKWLSKDKDPIFIQGHWAGPMKDDLNKLRGDVNERRRKG